LMTILRPLVINEQGESDTPEGGLLTRLENAYASYLDEHDQDPDADAEALLTQWFERMRGEDSENLGPFDEVRGLLYPIIKPHGFGESGPVFRRAVVDGELELLVAFDSGRTLRFIGPADLKKWPGVDEDEVYFFARENLLALCKNMNLQVLAGAAGTPSAVIVATGDSFDASKVILPDIYSKLAEVLGPEMLVGIPNRDFMIVLKAGDEEMAKNVASQVALDAQTRPYSISGKLYRLTADGLKSR